MDIPRQPSWLHFRNDHWPAVAAGLHLLAATGTSVRFELQSALAQLYRTTVRAGSIRRIFEHDLIETDLLLSQTVSSFGRHKLTLVRLSERGQELCRDLGWTVSESEWERLVRLHSADSQPQHTGAVLTFAYHARMRKWKTQTLPQVDSPNFFPDLLVEKNEQKIYVEVELGIHKLRKWRNMQQFQGFVALCAKTPASRTSLIRECREVGAVGMATDLKTLYQGGKEATISPLWVEEWK